MAPAPLVLHLYDEHDELIKTCTRTFVPWKMLKRSIRLYKQIGTKKPEDFEEADVDELTSFIVTVFAKDTLTIEELDEHAEISDMLTVLRASMNRARGSMDPTLPPKV